MTNNQHEGLITAKKLINECIRTKATFLDLGNCGLRDLDELPELWECQHLHELNLGSYYIKDGEYFNSKNLYNINKIGDNGARIIGENLKFLTYLNLNSNEIGDEGTMYIADNLKFLTYLDLGSNKIGSHGARVIANNLKLLTHLDLGWNKIDLEGIKLIVLSLKSLIHLDLGWNKIGDEGAKLIAVNLNKLTSLDLSGNQIGDGGAKCIAEHLKSLIDLNLGSNNLGNEGARVIGENLKALINLNLGNCRLNNEGAKVIGENLKSLIYLNLGWNGISDEGIKVISENLKSLEFLDLTSNNVGDKGARFIAENLKSLIFLYLELNDIGDEGSKAIGENLLSLTSLDLSANRIEDDGVRFICENLDKLTYLNLEDNFIKSFKSLLLILLRNSNLEVKPTSVPKNTGLYVSSNPFIDPPLEIIEQGKEAILEYYRQKELSGSKILQEAKVILLGDGRAGKTSLACRLLKNELPTEADRTLGVDIIIGNYSFSTNTGEFKLNIWDFAGQDKYKPLHQFFYSESSVYVFVADSGNAVTNFGDWFETAALYGQGSPLLVVMNEFSDGIGMGMFDEISWRRQFPRLIQNVHLVNLKSQKGFSDLEKDIQHLASQLPHTKHVFPQNWADIRLELERRRDENFITLQEFLKICKEKGIPERESAFILSSILHKIGVCLHYQKNDLLNQYIILKNEWATTAVYKILEDPIANEKRGFFNATDLKRIWAEDGYQDMIPQLLALMCEFKLAYPLPNNQEYITPHLLPMVPPGDWQPMSDGYVMVLVEYVFMPKALLTQFISSRHLDIDKGRTLVWRDGVVLRWPSNTIAEIRKIKSQGRDAFQILVKGIEQKGLLTSVLKTLRDLHHEFIGIQVLEYVPCTCDGCTSGKNKQHYFEFGRLTHRIEHNRDEVECEESLLSINIHELLGNLVLFEKHKRGEGIELKSDVSSEIREKEIKIFLASSSELEDDRDAFELYFRQQNDRLRTDKGIYLNIKRWENFLDAMSESRLQDEYNVAVRDCNIFVSLFFTKTGKFTEEEFDVAHQQFIDSGGHKPQIFTFFKNSDIKTGDITNEIKTLLAFKEKLKSLGHFYTKYNNTDDLKLKFRNQLDLLIENGKL